MKAEKGKRYRHYKGKEYTVLAVGRHTETLEEFVVYRAEYVSDDYGEGAIWIRPRAMFEEMLTLSDGVMIDRFTRID